VLDLNPHPSEKRRVRHPQKKRQSLTSNEVSYIKSAAKAGQLAGRVCYKLETGYN
jgi:hypothetical protein